MSTRISKQGRKALPTTLSAEGLPGLTPPAPDAPSPDASLSAAFRHVLGGKPGQGHLPVPSLKTGQEMAKRAKAERPGAPRGAPRKSHIGPRSGHK